MFLKSVILGRKALSLITRANLMMRSEPCQSNFRRELAFDQCISPVIDPARPIDSVVVRQTTNEPCSFVLFKRVSRGCKEALKRECLYTSNQIQAKLVDHSFIISYLGEST